MFYRSTNHQHIEYSLMLWSAVEHIFGEPRLAKNMFYRRPKHQTVFNMLMICAAVEHIFGEPRVSPTFILADHSGIPLTIAEYR